MTRNFSTVLPSRATVPLLLSLLLLTVAAGPASAAKAKAPKAAAGKTASAKDAPVVAPDDGYTGPMPADGKWLKDEQGRLYFVDTFEKAWGPVQRLGGRMVRTRFGIPIEVLKEDDKYFYYKVYRVAPVASEIHEPSAADVRRIALSYDVKTPTGHRLAFTAWGDGLPRQGQWRNGFDIADMNKDGHLDIVHGPARKSPGVPVIFLGDGKGHWHRWQTRFPDAPYDYGDAAVGDFDGDGNLDLALGVHLRGLLALKGDGKGGFSLMSKGLDMQYPGQGDDASGFSSRALATTDWNQDGRADIVALGEGPRLNVASSRDGSSTVARSYGPVVYLSQADGSWVKKQRGENSDTVFGDALAIADFNGDGRPDFLTGTNHSGLKGLLHLARPDGSWDVVELPEIRPNASIWAVAAADFDGDGRVDLAIGYLASELTWRSGVDVLFNRPGGKWERRGLAVLDGREGVTALAAGDLNGDGARDLVALTGEGQTWIFVGDGKGGFTREDASGIQQYPDRCRGYHVALADLDGDGKDEIVAAFAGEGSSVYDPDLCSTGGGILAWHAAPVSTAP